MPADIANINTAWSELLMTMLQRAGIQHVVISPGSRSTPLTVAAAQNQLLKTTTHFDERGAAFYALGLARATGKPAALICTSGSAVANYLPAVVESSMDNVPMLLLTADRPPELHGRGANQTIPQHEIYGVFARRAIAVGCPDDSESPVEDMKKIAAGLEIFRHRKSGPVHINCPFREPLAPDPDGAMPDTYLIEGNQWLEKYATDLLGRRHTDRMTKEYERILGNIDFSRRGVIVVGKLDSSDCRASILKLADHTGWPVIPDIQSGLRIGCPHKSLIGHADHLFLSKSWQSKLQSESILHIGGRITSKRTLSWLAQASPVRYIRIDQTDLRFDPNDQMTHTLVGNIPMMLAFLIQHHEQQSNPTWLNQWQQANEAVTSTMTSAIDEQLTELSVCRHVARCLAGEQFDRTTRPSLWAASSLPIRMLDMYADPAGEPLVVQANRGASGIDGTIASAAGYANGSEKPVVLVIGDLAFLHDLNSLDQVRRSAVPITVVLLNNDGANIFSLLPIAGHEDVFEKYFRTPHGLTFEAAAKQFELPHSRVDSLSQFRDTFSSNLAMNRSSIIEVSIDPEAGPAQMRKIADAIRGQLDAS